MSERKFEAFPLSIDEDQKKRLELVMGKIFDLLATLNNPDEMLLAIDIIRKALHKEMGIVESTFMNVMEGVSNDDNDA